jgi:arginine-tRNA-protein transferase
MAYKQSFRPLERLGRDGWRRMDEPEVPALDERRAPPLRMQPRRILIDA